MKPKNSIPHLRFFKKAVLAFFAQHGRKNLPWSKKDPSGYNTLVSEIMLQQTTVSTVLKRFPLFVATFPSFEALAQASPEEVMKAWEGLGYYRRARFLHEASKTIVAHHASKIPMLRKDRLALPGVGPSTASALGAFVYFEKEPIWDANVQRVFKRFWGEDVYKSLSKNWFVLTTPLMPSAKEDIPHYTQALMDLGATVCLPKNPLCHKCPLSKNCIFPKLSPEQQIQAQAPQPKPPKLVVKKNWVVVVNKKSEIALVPPQETGIWPGLWQLPESEKLKNDPVVSGTHQLTHRRVVYSVRMISVGDTDLLDDLKPSSWQWVPVSRLPQLAFPKPLAQWRESSLGLLKGFGASKQQRT